MHILNGARLSILAAVSVASLAPAKPVTQNDADNFQSGVYVMVEDWVGSKGVACDVFFDNIVLRVGPAGSNAVPEPVRQSCRRHSMGSSLDARRAG